MEFTISTPEFTVNAPEFTLRAPEFTFCSTAMRYILCRAMFVTFHDNSVTLTLTATSSG